MTYAEKCDTEIETIQYLKRVMKDDTIELMMPNLDIGETINPWGAKENCHLTEVSCLDKCCLKHEVGYFQHAINNMYLVLNSLFFRN